MSSIPPSNPQPPYAHTQYQPPPSNGMGIAGFVVSLCGLILCAGFLSPIGLVLSLIGLRKAPRGFAVGGTVIGTLGTLVAIYLVLAISGLVSSGGIGSWFNGQFMTFNTMNSASNDIDNYYANNNQTLPDQATGTALVSGYLDHKGTPIEYRTIPNRTSDYQLVSAGDDMQFGTNDDITQQFAAFGFASSVGPNQATPLDDGEPTSDQIDYAFNAAAERINGSFTAGQPLPDEATGTGLIRDLRDAWNGELRYAPTTGTFYHLKSAGPDRAWFTDDDITRTFFFDPAGGE